MKAREAELQNELTEHSVSFRQGKQEHDELTAEIKQSESPAQQHPR